MAQQLTPHSARPQKMTVAIVCLVLAVISASIGTWGGNPQYVTPARIFAFVFLLLGALFLLFGLLGRIRR